MNKNTPLISVIVPIYKAEVYLHRCIDSLLAQTFHDFEILLIDDGSSDNSGKICDEYAKKDKRIRVFHKANEGVSATREFGIKHAKGKYTIHCDSDDWVEPLMLEELYTKAEKENADYVICDYFVDRGNRSFRINQKPASISSHTVLSEIFYKLGSSCWNKLIKRECYNENVHFPENINFGEDLVINAQILMNNPKIAYLPMAFYHYIIGENINSMTKKIGEDTIEQAIKLREILLNVVKKDTLLERLVEERTSPIIVKKAFIAHIYTSKEFKQRFSCYKTYISTSKFVPLAERIFFYLSCAGFYKPMYCLRSTLLNIRKIIKGKGY